MAPHSSIAIGSRVIAVLGGAICGACPAEPAVAGVLGGGKTGPVAFAADALEPGSMLVAPDPLTLGD